jgi:hypothetical protein
VNGNGLSVLHLGTGSPVFSSILSLHDGLAGVVDLGLAVLDDLLLRDVVVDGRAVHELVARRPSGAGSGRTSAITEKTSKRRI